MAEGALEGIVIASALNALTTRTTVNSLIRLTSRTAELVNRPGVSGGSISEETMESWL